VRAGAQRAGLHRGARGQRGFTLVEVLIAMGITAAMAAMTIGSLRDLDHASEVARQQDERYAAARVALSRMTREISMAFLSDNYDSKRFREPVTLFVGRDDELMLSTMSHVRLYRDAKESDQAVVAYRLDSDPDHGGEKALFRREKVRLDDEPDRGGRTDLVADHVTSLRFQYWDTRRREWAREWTTRGTEHPRELPPRVRIELEMKLADGRTEKFATETRIEIRTPLAQ
jgi:general secretion pathway protein J